MEKRTYKPADETRERVLKAAIELSESTHYRSITRREIAEFAGVAESNVSRLFHNMFQFRVAVVEYAVEHECFVVIAQAIAVRDHAVRDIPMALQRQALDGIL